MPFKKGQSGNPKGRAVEQLSKDIWKKHGPAALATIVEMAKNAEEPKIKLDASKYICDQAYGKAAQAIEAKVEHDMILNLIFGSKEKS